jgi:prevent-host-death family protein
MNTLSITELRRRLSQILDEVEKFGRSFIITRYGKPIAVLQPHPPKQVK